MTRIINLESKARTLDELGKSLMKKGDLKGAEEKHIEALNLRKSHGSNPGDIAYGLNYLGRVLTRQKRWEEAEETLSKSLKTFEESSDIKQQSIVFSDMADLFRRKGDLSKALACVEGCVKLLKVSPNEKTLARVLSMKGKICRISKEWTKAREATLGSLNLWKKIGDLNGQRSALSELGQIYRLRNDGDDLDMALEYFKESINIKPSEQEDNDVLNIIYERIADIYLKQRKWSEAADAYKKSLSFAEKGGSDRMHAIAYTKINLATMSAMQGQKEAALKQLQEAIDLISKEKLGKSLQRGTIHLKECLKRNMEDGSCWPECRVGAFIYHSKKMREEVNKWRDESELVNYLESLRKDYLDQGRLMEEAITLCELGSVHRKSHNFAQSEEVLTQALDIFKQIELFSGQATCWHKLASLFEAQELWEKAETAYKESINLKQICLDDEGKGISLGHLADMYIKNCRVKDAKTATEAELEIFSTFGSSKQKRHPLLRLLWLEAEDKNLPGAQKVVCEIDKNTREGTSDLIAMVNASNWDGVKTYCRPLLSY